MHDLIPSFSVIWFQIIYKLLAWIYVLTHGIYPKIINVNPQKLGAWAGCSAWSSLFEGKEQSCFENYRWGGFRPQFCTRTIYFNKLTRILRDSHLLQYLSPFLEKERYQLLPNCRLHHENNLYRDQEEHKIHVDINEWKCGYCGKRFYEEKYVDKHFDNRHYDMLNAVSGRFKVISCIFTLVRFSIQ